MFVRRLQFGESVLRSVNSMQEILIAVLLNVLPSVLIGGGGSAVPKESRNVTTYQDAVLKSLTASMAL